MQKEFVVRVGKGFLIGRDQRKQSLLTLRYEGAGRFDYEEAMKLATCSVEVFPDAIIYVAHQQFPDEEFNPDSPRNYVIAVGRRFVKTLSRTSIVFTFSLQDAGRFTSASSQALVHLAEKLLPGKSVYAAHQHRPFIPVASTDDDDMSEPGDQPN